MSDYRSQQAALDEGAASPRPYWLVEPRTADSLGEAERDAFWRPAGREWPVYWWRSDVLAWVCAPTITATIQTNAHLDTDGHVRRSGGFVELVLDDRGRPV